MLKRLRSPGKTVKKRILLQWQKKHKKHIIRKTFKLAGMKTTQPLVRIKNRQKVGMLSAFFYDE